MTDDLIKRLRMWPDPTCYEAADRIEKLEKALADPTKEDLGRLQELIAKALFAVWKEYPWEDCLEERKGVYRDEAKAAVAAFLEWRKTK